MMDKLQRYSMMGLSLGHYQYTTESDGDWVKYDDVAELEALVDRLKEQNKLLANSGRAEDLKEIERLKEQIEQVKSALRGADKARHSCKNYAELGVSNGLALGRIAIIIGLKWEEGGTC